MRQLSLVAFALVLATSAHAAMTISSAKTKNVNCTGGVCTPTAANANLNVNDLITLLATSDVTVKSSASVPTLGVLDPLTWSNTHRLTLDAYESIHVRAPIVVEGTSGLTLITNDGGTGGDYEFDAPGSVTFWDLASSLVINGQSFTLVGDIKTLASGIASNPSGHYALANNYDASADGTYATSPIATFKGTLEGLGNVVSQLGIVSNAKHAAVGLCGILMAGGTIRDINLSRAHVSGQKQFDTTGLLVGESYGAIVASNVDGTASGHDDSVFTPTAVGGLAGFNAGTITRSSSAAVVIGHGNGITTGGLVGGSDGVIILSHATGAVRGGAVSGGLVGGQYGTIEQSYATGNVVTADSGTAGGLVGINSVGSPARIRQSYATGAVTSRNNEATLGGLVGENDGPISQSYATGAVNAQAHSGGFVGGDFGAAAHYALSYWDITTTGEDNGFGAGGGPGVTGLTDDQLKAELPRGFHASIWGQNASINNGWPYLLANPPQ